MNAWHKVNADETSSFRTSSDPKRSVRGIAKREATHRTDHVLDGSCKIRIGTTGELRPAGPLFQSTKGIRRTDRRSAWEHAL